MGAESSVLRKDILNRFQVVGSVPDSSVSYLQEKSTRKQFLLRELVFNNDQTQFQKTRSILQNKKRTLQNQHVVPIEAFVVEEKDQLCSTHQKIYVFYEYPHRNLDQEISQRNLQRRKFEETEAWSIIASCVLGLAHLQRLGIRHESLSTRQILLQNSGIIKVADPAATALSTNYQQLFKNRHSHHLYLAPQLCSSLANQQPLPPITVNSYKSDVFTLGVIMLEVGLLNYQDECYRDNTSRINWETLKYNVERFGKVYSPELKLMIQHMLNPDPERRPDWIELENFVRKSDSNELSKEKPNLVVAFQQAQSVQGQHPPAFLQTHIPQNPSSAHPAQQMQPRSIQRQSSQAKLLRLGGAASTSEPQFISKSMISQVQPRIGAVPASVYNTHVQVDENLVEGSQDDSEQQQFRDISINKQVFHVDPSSIAQEARQRAQIPQMVVGPHTNIIAQGARMTTPTILPAVTSVPSGYFPFHNTPFTQVSSIYTNQVASPNYAILPPLPRTNIHMMNGMGVAPGLTTNSRPNSQQIGAYSLPRTANGNPVFTQMNPQLPSVSSIRFPNYNGPTSFNHGLVADLNSIQTFNPTLPRATTSNTDGLFTDYAKLGISKPSNYTTITQETHIPTITSNFNSLLGKTHILSTTNVESQPLIRPPSDRNLASKPFKQPLHDNNSHTNSKNYSPVKNAMIESQELRVNTSHHFQPTAVSHITHVSPSTPPLTSKYVVETFKQGSKYQGQKVNDMRHGKGKFFYQDGGLYDGDWRENKMHGFGKLYYQSGKIAYEGEWENDQFKGHGILYNEFPVALDKPFNYSNFDYLDEFWIKFEGNFVDDLKEGKGKLYLTNGECYEGNFEGDSVNGPGVYQTMDGRQVKGIWKQNVLASD